MSHDPEPTRKRKFTNRMRINREVSRFGVGRAALLCPVCYRRIEFDTDGISGEVFELVRTPTGGRELHDCLKREEP